MSIKENMGDGDRVIRAIAATIFVALFFNGITYGALGLISLAAAVMFLTTAIFGVCPLYSLLRLNTKWKQAGH